MFKDDAVKNALHASRNDLNDLPVDKVRLPCPDIGMNPWHSSIEIFNHRFIVKQGPESVDQVYKMCRNRCEKALLIDPAEKLCLPESPCPPMALLCPGSALLNIPPRQFGVNLNIIQIYLLHSRHEADPAD